MGTGLRLCFPNVLALQVLELMEGGDLRSALSGTLSGYNSWYNNGRILAMDIVRGVFYLHGEPPCKFFPGQALHSVSLSGVSRRDF